MAYQVTKKELEASRRAAVAEAAARPAKTAMKGGDGYLRRRIPAKAYFNAIRNHGVDPNDEGYWQDMERLYPECRVAYTPTRVCLTTMTPRFRAPGERALSRLGRVTSRTVYRTIEGKVIKVHL